MSSLGATCPDMQLRSSHHRAPQEETAFTSSIPLQKDGHLNVHAFIAWLSHVGGEPTSWWEMC